MVDHALSDRAAIQAERARLRSALATARAQKAGLLPQLSVDAGTGYEVADNPTTQLNERDGTANLYRYDASVVARQLLFDNGGVANRTRAARRRADAVSQDLRGIEEQIALDVATAYLSYLRFQEIVSVAQESVQVHESIAERVGRQVELGRSSDADAQQIQARLSFARAELARFQGRLSEARGALQQVSGMDFTTLTYPNSSRGEESVEALIDMAMASSPAIAGAMERERAAEHDMRATKAPFLPEISLEARATKGEDLNGLRGSNEAASIQLRARYPLYVGGGDQARRKAALEAKSAARLDRTEIERQVREAIVRAYALRAAAQARLLPTQQQVTASAAVVRSYLSQYDLGRRSLFDVLNAQLDYFNAQIALADARAGVLEAHYELLANTGKLVENLSST